jgi:hypothetical protein
LLVSRNLIIPLNSRSKRLSLVQMSSYKDVTERPLLAGLGLAESENVPFEPDEIGSWIGFSTDNSTNCWRVLTFADSSSNAVMHWTSSLALSGDGVPLIRFPCRMTKDSSSVDIYGAWTRCALFIRFNHHPDSCFRSFRTSIKEAVRPLPTGVSLKSAA